MAQAITCDMHDEPFPATFMVTNIDNGDAMGLCPVHLVAMAASLGEALQAMAETPDPEQDTTQEPPAFPDAEQEQVADEERVPATAGE